MPRFKFNPITRRFNVVKDALDLGASFKGAYEDATSYTVGQSVVSTGHLYVCLVDTVGRPPPDALYWEALALQGPAGPQGAPGPIGPASGEGAILVAGETLGGHRMLTLNDASQAIYADHTTPSHAGKIVGLSLGSAVSGADVTVRLFGLITESSWQWDVTRPRVFLSSAGQMTQTPPASGFVCVIGHVISETQLFIRIQPSITLV